MNIESSAGARVGGIRSKRAVKILIGVALVAGGLAGAGALALQKGWVGNVSSVATTPEAISGTVVAIVDGEPVYESELLGEAGGQNIPHGILLENYLTKVAAARLTSINDEAKAAALFAERQERFGRFVREERERAAKAITEANVKEYYDKNIVDSLFAKYAVSYYLTRDERDALTTLEDIKAGKPKSTDKLKAIEAQKGGGRYFVAQELPYETGRIVVQMKKGDITPTPLIVRDGFLILRLDEVQAGSKPSLAEATPQITEILTQQRVTNRIREARKVADIRLK